VDNHPNDHVTLVSNLSDIIVELGPKPADFLGQSLTERLSFLTNDPAVGISFHTAAGAAGHFTFQVGAAPVELTINEGSVVLGAPLALAAGGITTDLALAGDGVGHRLMLGSSSPYQVFKGGEGLFHVNVDGTDILLINPVGGITLWQGPTIIPSAGGFLTISASGVTLLSSAGQQHLIHSGPSGSQGADLFVQNNSVRIAGTTVAETWQDRPLVVTTKAGSGQCGIGFSNLASSLTAQMYVYNQPTLAFDFRNADNTAWLPLRASAFNVSSSARFKERIQPWEGEALATIDQLVPSEYDRDGRRELGLIAEQVAEVFPIAVGHDQEGPALLDVQQLVVLALAGIAELNRKLAA
jgi:hypothetical protein